MPATVELFRAQASPRGAWGVLMPGFFNMSHSVLHEIVEWPAAEVYGGDLGQASRATSGTRKKDMVLATAGALLARLAMLTIDARRLRSGA